MMKLIFSRAMNYNQENKYVYTTIKRLEIEVFTLLENEVEVIKIKIIYNINEMKLNK